MKKLDLNKAVATIENFIGGSLFFVMMLFTSLNVFILMTGGKRLNGLEEIVLGAYVWVSYIALGRHYKEHTCVSVDFLVKLLPPSAAKVLDIFRDIVVMIIGAVMIYYGTLLTVASLSKPTKILKIPHAYFDLALVLGYISVIGYTISKYVPKKKT